VGHSYGPLAGLFDIQTRDATSWTGDDVWGATWYGRDQNWAVAFLNLSPLQLSMKGSCI